MIMSKRLRWQISQRSRPKKMKPRSWTLLKSKSWKRKCNTGKRSLKMNKSWNCWLNNSRINLKTTMISSWTAILKYPKLYMWQTKAKTAMKEIYWVTFIWNFQMQQLKLLMIQFSYQLNMEMACKICMVPYSTMFLKNSSKFMKTAKKNV